MTSPDDTAASDDGGDVGESDDSGARAPTTEANDGTDAASEDTAPDAAEDASSDNRADGTDATAHADPDEPTDPDDSPDTGPPPTDAPFPGGTGSAEASPADGAPDADGDTSNADASTADREPVTDGHGTGEIGSPTQDGTGGNRGGESFLDAPPHDEERPLAEHIEELVHRLAIIVAAFILATAVAFLFAERMIDFLWRSFLPPGDRPHLYGPLEFLFTKFLVAGLAGVVASLPTLVYEAYRFMRPGLYEHERRYYLASVPTSLVLAGIGMAFAYFLVLPTVFAYFTTYTQGAAQVAFGLGETFNLIVILMAYLAFVFQIPLFVMLAIMMGVTDRQWLEGRRLIFWGVFLGLAFIFTPDPTGMAPVIVAATMVALFEGTLLLLRWTGR